MKKKILIIGPKQSGKTTIANYFEKKEISNSKKAHIVFGSETIDTPSSYLSSPWMRQHIISLQQKAYVVLFLVPLNTRKITYPPGFTQIFRVPVIGVITYTAADEINTENKKKSREYLERIGIFKEIHYININKQDQIQQIIKNIEKGGKE